MYTSLDVLQKQAINKHCTIPYTWQNLALSPTKQLIWTGSQIKGDPHSKTFDHSVFHPFLRFTFSWAFIFIAQLAYKKGKSMILCKMEKGLPVSSVRGRGCNRFHMKVISGLLDKQQRTGQRKLTWHLNSVIENQVKKLKNNSERSSQTTPYLIYPIQTSWYGTGVGGN